MTARFADEITAADLFETAYRYHLAGIALRLHDPGPMATCAAPPCVAWRSGRGA